MLLSNLKIIQRDKREGERRKQPRTAEHGGWMASCFYETRGSQESSTANTNVSNKQHAVTSVSVLASIRRIFCNITADIKGA